VWICVVNHQARFTHLRLQVFPDRVESRLRLRVVPRRPQEVVRHGWRTEPGHRVPLHRYTGIDDFLRCTAKSVSSGVKFHEIFTDRVSTGGYAIASFRPFVCPFVSSLTYELINL